MLENRKYLILILELLKTLNSLGFQKCKEWSQDRIQRPVYCNQQHKWSERLILSINKAQDSVPMSFIALSQTFLDPLQQYNEILNLRPAIKYDLTICGF